MTVFDYYYKILTVVFTGFSGTNIFSNVNNKQLLGLITSVFSLSFSLSFGIIIKLQQETKLRKNCIENCNCIIVFSKKQIRLYRNIISNSIRDGIISHDEFLEILKEKKYIMVRRMKTKLRMFKKIF